MEGLPVGSEQMGKILKSHLRVADTSVGQLAAQLLRRGNRYVVQVFVAARYSEGLAAFTAIGIFQAAQMLP